MESDRRAVLRSVIAAYKADFKRIDDEERYKWETIKHYQDNWNIDAPDFAGMYAEAFRYAGKPYKRERDGKQDGGNLLASGNYYAYRMMCQMTQFDPEGIRGLFRQLLGETRPLAQRISAFMSGCQDCFERLRTAGLTKENDKKHDQDLRAVTLYLNFEYPGKYFFYKDTMFKNFASLLGSPSMYQSTYGGKFMQALSKYYDLCDEVLREVKADHELRQLSMRRLDHNCYKDEQFHVLTMDIIYFGNSLMDKYKTTDEVKKILEKYAIQTTDIGKNTVLYGPPGTGKTYHTAIYAVAIVENKPLSAVEKEPYEAVLERYKMYKADGYIEFITFHQSYGYEEFIEGIRPTVERNGEETADIEYEIAPGIFKSFCERASQPIVRENRRNYAAGAMAVALKHMEPVVDAAEGRNYVFIIDEINRGNISKIFGELITLIEPDKRLGQREELTAVLPYSKKPFGVSDNVYLIGTMNTADRSIAAIDTALRRRFQFIEMMPDPELLRDIKVAEISVADMLERMNRRIQALYDREHTIGHGYFMPLREDPTVEKLAEIFKMNILPLLQEYFYDDYEKIRLVLGDNQKGDGEPQFVKASPVSSDLFGDADVDSEDKMIYEIDQYAFDSPEAYSGIYR